MSSTMKAAIHIGPNHTQNLEIYKNAKFEEIQNFFDITQKLIQILFCAWEKFKILTHGSVTGCKDVFAVSLERPNSCSPTL